jgi:hypothetical protein
VATQPRRATSFVAPTKNARGNATEPRYYIFGANKKNARGNATAPCDFNLAYKNARGNATAPMT